MGCSPLDAGTAFSKSALCRLGPKGRPWKCHCYLFQPHYFTLSLSPLAHLRSQQEKRLTLATLVVETVKFKGR